MKFDLNEILPSRSSWKYLKLEDSQVVFFELENGLTIKLTLADTAFEWHLDIYSRQNQLLLNNWYDLYGDTDEKQLTDLKSELNELIGNITNFKSRVSIDAKWPFVIKKFQILKNDLWIDLISKKTFKLF